MVVAFVIGRGYDLRSYYITSSYLRALTDGGRCVITPLYDMYNSMIIP